MAKPTQAQIAAAEAAAEESASRAAQDAAEAQQAKRRGLELASSIRRLNAANHFSRWLFRDAAGGET
jgi:site-specific recombinase XerC